MKTYYTNAQIFSAGVIFSNAALCVEQGKTLAIVPVEEISSTAQVVDLHGGILTPGFVETQANGGGGVLFNEDPSVHGLDTMLKAHRKFGTVAMLPTFITDSTDRLEQAIQAVRDGIAKGLKGLIGGHFEGPFINPVRKGTHQEAYIRAVEAEDFHRFNMAGMGQSLVTLAPERCDPAFIEHLSSQGFKINAGHTMASKADMERGIRAGVTGVTHLFNAMPPLAGREPAVIGTAAQLGLSAGIIVDGIHCDPLSLQLAFKMFGAERLMLVTDSMHTIGVEGIEEFDLMGVKVKVRGNALINEFGSLAGAHVTMIQCVRNVVDLLHLSRLDALKMAVSTPARYVNRPDLATIINRDAGDILHIQDNWQYSFIA